MLNNEDRQAGSYCMRGFFWGFFCVSRHHQDLNGGRSVDKLLLNKNSF